MKKENFFFKKAYRSILLVLCLGVLLYLFHIKQGDAGSASSEFAALGTPTKRILGEKVNNTPDSEIEGNAYWVLSPGKVVNVLSFSPDGKSLIIGHSSSNDLADSQAIEFWDVKSRKKRLSRENTESEANTPLDGVSQVAFSSNGKVMASLHLDGKAIIWNVGSFSEDVRSSANLASALRSTSVSSIGFTAEGELLLHTLDHSHIMKFDLANGKLTETLLAVPQESMVTFSPAGGIVEIGSWGDDKFDIKLFDWKTGKQTQFIGSYDIAPGLLTFSPDGKFLAIPTDDNLEVWNTVTKKLEGEFSRSEQAGQSVAFAATAPLVASDNNDGDTYVWNLQSKSQPKVISTGDTEAKLAFSPDGHTLAGGFENGVIKLWRIEF